MFIVADTIHTTSESPRLAYYWHRLAGPCEAESVLPERGQRMRIELPDGRRWVVTVRNRTIFKGECALSFDRDTGRDIGEGARIMPAP